jgi:hypothetical protein
MPNRKRSQQLQPLETDPATAGGGGDPPARAASGFNSTIPWDQARIHAASIYCSDGRFGEQMDEFLHQGLGLPRYDRLAVPGGPACLSGALSVFWESHSAERQLDFLCHVHKLERLIMIAHEGCAFYLEWLKVKPEEFAARQMEDVKRAATRVRQTQPTLKVDAYVARRQDARVWFEPIPIALAQPDEFRVPGRR